MRHENTSPHMWEVNLKKIEQKLNEKPKPPYHQRMQLRKHFDSIHDILAKMYGEIMDSKVNYCKLD